MLQYFSRCMRHYDIYKLIFDKKTDGNIYIYIYTVISLTSKHLNLSQILSKIDQTRDSLD